MFYRNGVYYVRKKIRGIRQKMSTGKRDYKSALRRYHEIMKAWNDGESGWTDREAVPTFESYWKDHYRPAYTVNKTPVPRADPNNVRFQDDGLTASFLNTPFARRPMNAITKTMCQQWVNQRKKQTYTRQEGGELHTISAGTVRREITCLQAIFQQALEDGLIEKNPWKSIEREPYVIRERVLTAEEQTKLLAHLNPSYQRWVLFMLGTGLRLEEARGINPATDLNFSERWVRVTRKGRGVKKPVQDVPLIDEHLLDVLQEQLTEEGQLWPQTQPRFREALSQAAEKAGIEHLSPHSLRHTFGTRYLQGGGNIYHLSKILGHASVEMTEKVYAHLQQPDLLALSRHVKLGLREAVPAKVLPFEREA